MRKKMRVMVCLILCMILASTSVLAENVNVSENEIEMNEMSVIDVQNEIEDMSVEEETITADTLFGWEDEEEDEYVTVTGAIYDMGYQFEKEPSFLNDNVFICANCIDETDSTPHHRAVYYVEGGEGYYELKLLKGKKYKLCFSVPYCSGLIRPMYMEQEIMGDQEINFAVQTKMVLGFATINEYRDKYPAELCIVDTSASKEKIEKDVLRLDLGRRMEDGETVYIQTANLSVSSQLRKQIQVDNIDSASMFRYSNYNFFSTDENVAIVDNKGMITAVGVGTAEIGVSVSNVPSTWIETTAPIMVNVTKGFSAIHDGWPVVNSSPLVNAERYYDEENSIIPGAKPEDNIWKRDSDKEYYIPYDVYQSVFKNYSKARWYMKNPIAFNDELFSTTSYKGNCFGQAVTAALLNMDNYDGREKLKSLGLDQYKAYHSLNACGYDMMQWYNSYPYAKIAFKTKSTIDFIEQYVVWQDSMEIEKWRSDYEVSFDDIINEWELGKTYRIAYYWENKEKERCGHSVILDTSREVPEKSDQEYKLYVYDCNKPAFTDEWNEEYSKICVSYNGEYQNNDGNNAFILYDKENNTGKANTALNANENSENIEINEIHFFDLTRCAEEGQLALDFHGQYTLDTAAPSNPFVKPSDECTFQLITKDETTFEINADDNSSGILKIYLKNQTLRVEGPKGTKVLNPVTGNNSNLSSVLNIQALVSDIEIESDQEISVIKTDNGKVSGVVCTGNSFTEMDHEKIKVSTKEKGSCLILNERHSGEDDKYSSVFLCADNEEGNEIETSLNDNNEYSLNVKNETDVNFMVQSDEVDEPVEKSFTAKEKVTVSFDNLSDPNQEVKPMEPSNPSDDEPEDNPGNQPGDNPGTNSGAGTNVQPDPNPGAGTNVEPNPNMDLTKGNTVWKKQIITTKKIKTYKEKDLKKKKIVFKLNAKASGKGKLSYKVTRGKSRYITVSKNGKVTLKKGCKKGTYSIRITANARNNYKKATKTVKIRVK